MAGYGRFGAMSYEEMADETKDLRMVEELQTQGHTHHCACRQVWGDGECECSMGKHETLPFPWMDALRDIKLQKGEQS